MVVNLVRCRLAARTLARTALIRLLVYGSCLAGVVPAHPQGLAASHEDDFQGHPRMIVISDIGNEPDDQMSLTRLLVYSNKIDIEALIAATSTWQRNVTHPETMCALIKAYRQVRPNLLLNAPGWPAAEELEQRVYTGQPGYGMAATGPDKMSEGAQSIVEAADRKDDRPLWVTIWGGANTL